MAHSSGQMLHHYRLVEPIGEGGMGVVWRARDTSLDRDVAIKILPEDVARHPDRLARFEREAKAVAALAHPNILAIHAFDRDGDVVFVVTELLQGEDLRHRLAQGALPPRKAVEIARDAARGLSAAHDKGLVHRDIKPDNLFLTREGMVKILDFGLAASLTPAGVGDATMTGMGTRTALTSPGTVMGTVDYMSPEQARGEAVDTRSDIFSLGTVIHEMLTGRRPFQRETSAETMTAILREDPPELSQSGTLVSPALDRVIRRCLEKRPDERFQSARDLAFALENAVDATIGSGSRAEAAAAASPKRRGRGRGLLLALPLLAVGLAAGFGLAVLVRRPAPLPEPVRQTTITFSGDDLAPSASPDGRMIAFASQRDGRLRIWIKQFPGGGEQVLTEGPDNQPRFAPDGASVLFVRSEGTTSSLYRQALIGGEPRKVVPEAGQGDWSPDGTRVVFVRTTTNQGIREERVGIADARDGTETILLSSDRNLYGVRWSPDGKTLICTASSTTGNTDDYELFLIDAATGTLTRRQLGGVGGIISAPVFDGDSRAVLLGISGSIMGDQGATASRVVRYQLDSGLSEPLFWTEHIFPNIGIRSGGVRMDIVAPGTVVFDAAPIHENLLLFALDSTPGSPPARLLTRGNGRDRQPAWSPDGRSILFSSGRSGNLDLWLLDVATGALRQVTDDGAQDWDPGWAPDGRSIVWSSNRSGNLEIWAAGVDGSHARQVSGDGIDAENPVYTPDGQWIVYWSANPDKQGIWKIRADGSDAVQLAAGVYLQTEVSPDGRWVNFITMEAERLRSVIHFADLQTGTLLPRTIEVRSELLRTEDVILGRSRWLSGGTALAFVGLDEDGRSGIYVQDFDPASDTSATRRKLAGFSNDYTTESFGISPDGRHIAIAGVETSFRLVLAENVPGVRRP